MTTPRHELLWVVNLDRIEGGDPQRMVALCQQLGVAGLLVKTRDGRSRQKAAPAKLVARVSTALHDAELQLGVWAWTYPSYGALKTFGYVETQAVNLAADANDFGAVLAANNAESPWSYGTAANQSRWGGKAAAKAAIEKRAACYHAVLKSSLPHGVARGLSSFPRPHWHALPWGSFFSADDGLIGMPQVYFPRPDGMTTTIREAVSRWRAIAPGEVRVTGIASPWKLSAHTTDDMRATVAEADRLGVAVDYYSADICDLPEERSAFAHRRHRVASLDCYSVE